MRLPPAQHRQHLHVRTVRRLEDVARHGLTVNAQVHGALAEPGRILDRNVVERAPPAAADRIKRSPSLSARNEP